MVRALCPRQLARRDAAGAWAARVGGKNWRTGKPFSILHQSVSGHASRGEGGKRLRRSGSTPRRRWPLGLAAHASLRGPFCKWRAGSMAASHHNLTYELTAL